MPRTGRPKTGAGHRDDAMLGIIDFEGRIDALILEEQDQHRERSEAEVRRYRSRRDLLSAMKEDLRSAALSWRYGEIADSLDERTAGDIARRLRGES